MGVLTDILIADRSHAPAVASADAPLQKWRGIDAKGVELVKLSMLAPVLDETEYHSAAVRDFALVAARHGADGPWVYAVPATLMATLASLDPDTIQLRADEWFEFARDGFCEAGYRRGDVRLLLTALADLAQAAQRDRTELLVRIAL